MEHQTISLATKPGASLHISTFFPDPATKQPSQKPLKFQLLVFLNGLILSSAGWSPAATQLIHTRQTAHLPLPALLAYDRFGQGASDPDPSDPPSGTPYGHDAQAIITDLHQLLTQITESRLHTTLPSLSLIFVANSIGCPLARLYAAAHPGSVAAFIFLDSMMANSDFVSLFPDPDAADFDPGTLPDDISVDDILHARERVAKLFHPTVPNPEHFDRRNLAELLPHADGPVLPPGPGGKPPRVAVVGHDFEEFARQCEEGSLQVPKHVINAYVNPAWYNYNKGLTQLGDSDGEVKITKGCGHFIQKDDPEYVAREIGELLDRLAGE